MPLAETFDEIVESLPSDWTGMELDLRVQEDRYIDAATLLVTCNAQPYSRHDWHFRILVAHNVRISLTVDVGVAGELVLREVRTGRVETIQDWGRPESFRREFRRLRAQ